MKRISTEYFLSVMISPTRYIRVLFNHGTGHSPILICKKNDPIITSITKPQKKYFQLEPTSSSLEILGRKNFMTARYLISINNAFKPIGIYYISLTKARSTAEQWNEIIKGRLLHLR
jgi:hypothetical protein